MLLKSRKCKGLFLLITWSLIATLGHENLQKWSFCTNYVLYRVLTRFAAPFMCYFSIKGRKMTKTSPIPAFVAKLTSKSVIKTVIFHCSTNLNALYRFPFSPLHQELLIAESSCRYVTFTFLSNEPKLYMKSDKLLIEVPFHDIIDVLWNTFIVTNGAHFI